METVKAPCNACGGLRNAFVQATHSRQWDDEEAIISWGETMNVLECCGCGGLSVQREAWSSDDPYGPKVTYWPPQQARIPIWYMQLTDRNLKDAMREVYVALNQELRMLTAVGVRTLLDRAFYLILLKDHGSFAKKLEVMVEGEFLLPGEKDIFQKVANVGNAAAHSGHAPSQETLIRILRATESFLYQKFILPLDATAAETQTPKRGE